MNCRTKSYLTKVQCNGIFDVQERGTEDWCPRSQNQAKISFNNENNLNLLSSKYVPQYGSVESR